MPPYTGTRDPIPAGSVQAGDFDLSDDVEAFLAAADAAAARAAIDAPQSGTSAAASGRIYIEVLAPPKATVGTWVIYANGAYIHGGFRYNTSNALEDSIAWEVNLAAGTWELWMLHVVDPTRGIVTWELDDGEGTYTALGVIDGYTSGEQTVENTISGIVVASDVPTRTLRARVTGQNAAATGRLFSPLMVHLQKTA